MINLKERAIKIQGSDYILVSDRVLAFNADYPNGAIQTEMVKMEGEMIIMKATAIPDVATPTRFFTGYAQEIIGDGFINKTSALENAETSAVGRALGMMGIGVLDSIASADEIVKANNRSVEPKKTFPKPTYEPNSKEVLLWIDIPYSKENVAMIKTLEWAGWKDDRKQWRCADTPENREKLKNMKMIKTIHDNQGKEITL